MSLAQERDTYRLRPVDRNPVVVVGPLVHELTEALAARWQTVSVAPRGPVGHDRLIRDLVTVLVTSSKTGVEVPVLDAFPNLKAIANFGVGVEQLDRAYLDHRDIRVANTPDVLSDCVADLAVGELIALARRIPEADGFVRSGAWSSHPFGVGRRVTGMRIGIVGLGRIGRRVADRLAGFRVDVRYHGRRPVGGSDLVHEPSLLQLARWCDALVVTVPGTPETHHLVSGNILDALDGKLLVNVSRGSTVDERALVDALAAGRLAGAALDVFDEEPTIPVELASMRNVVLSPHIGSATAETRADMVRLVVANVAAYLSTGRLVTPAWPSHEENR